MKHFSKFKKDLKSLFLTESYKLLSIPNVSFPSI